MYNTKNCLSKILRHKNHMVTETSNNKSATIHTEP